MPARGIRKACPNTMVDRLLGSESHVRVWRQHRRLTLADLAAKARIGKGYLSQIENRQQNATVATLRKLAEALGVKLDDLSDG